MRKCDTECWHQYTAICTKSDEHHKFEFEFNHRGKMKTIMLSSGGGEIKPKVGDQRQIRWYGSEWMMVPLPEYYETSPT